MRLIDADAVLEELKRMEVEMMPAKLAHIYTAVVVEDSPTIDAVPIVRCKDCKHSEYDELFHMRWCNGEKVKDDGYCSYGERKDDETD